MSRAWFGFICGALGFFLGMAFLAFISDPEVIAWLHKIHDRCRRRRPPKERKK